MGDTELAGLVDEAAVNHSGSAIDRIGTVLLGMVAVADWVPAAATRSRTEVAADCFDCLEDDCFLSPYYIFFSLTVHFILATIIAYHCKREMIIAVTIEK